MIGGGAVGAPEVEADLAGRIDGRVADGVVLTTGEIERGRSAAVGENHGVAGLNGGQLRRGRPGVVDIADGDGVAGDGTLGSEASDLLDGHTVAEDEHPDGVAGVGGAVGVEVGRSLIAGDGGEGEALRGRVDGGDRDLGEGQLLVIEGEVLHGEAGAVGELHGAGIARVEEQVRVLPVDGEVAGGAEQHVGAGVAESQKVVGAGIGGQRLDAVLDGIRDRGFEEGAGIGGRRIGGHVRRGDAFGDQIVGHVQRLGAGEQGNREEGPEQTARQHLAIVPDRAALASTIASGGAHRVIDSQMLWQTIGCRSVSSKARAPARR